MYLAGGCDQVTPVWCTKSAISGLVCEFLRIFFVKISELGNGKPIFHGYILCFIATWATPRIRTFKVMNGGRTLLGSSWRRDVGCVERLTMIGYTPLHLAPEYDKGQKHLVQSWVCEYKITVLDRFVKNTITKMNRWFLPRTTSVAAPLPQYTKNLSIPPEIIRAKAAAPTRLPIMSCAEPLFHSRLQLRNGKHPGSPCWSLLSVNEIRQRPAVKNTAPIPVC
jgi:hypothetical protein